MRIQFWIPLALFALLLFGAIVAACAQVPAMPANTPVPPAPSAAPSTFAAPATSTPIDLTRQDPGSAKRANGLPDECSLISIGNVATVFAAETNQPLYGSSRTDHPIFAGTSVPTAETYCTYLAFHQSGSASGRTYQATYWTDTPDGASSSQWEQVWNDARTKAAHDVPNVGDAAFYSGGRLTFKKGNTFVTIEVIDTKLNTATPEGMEQQIEVERRLAQYALSKMG